MRGFADRLISYIYPERCVICDRILPRGERLCAECRGDAEPLDILACIAPDGRQAMFFCAAPYIYRDKIRNSILRMKFSGRPEYAVFYAEEIVGVLNRTGCVGSFDFVTSVPMDAERLRKRGYNQAELIARRVARVLGLPYVETLKKVRRNSEQHKLTTRREREKNVRGAYQIIKKEKIDGGRMLLVDDIVTTGSTISECVRILRLAGATYVLCGCGARVE